MPRVEDFSMASILSFASAEVEEFTGSVKSMSRLYKDDLSEEIQDIILKQRSITNRICEVDRMATQTLGATQARAVRVQADIHSLQGGEFSGVSGNCSNYVLLTNLVADILATEAEKAYDSMTSLISMLHEIDALLPSQERLYPSKSPHKKHYPRLHALMQSNPPRLQSAPISSVSSSHHNSRNRSVSTFSSHSILQNSKKSPAISLKHTSSQESTRSPKNTEPTDIAFPQPHPKSPILSLITNTNISYVTHGSALSIQTPNTITLGTSSPGNSEIAFVSSEEEHSDEEDVTSPMELNPVKSAPPTTSVSIQPANVPVGYSPAMLNLQSVLPSPTKPTSSPIRNIKESRSQSFDSLGSAESDASIRSLANHPLDIPKNTSSAYGDRRKSAPFMLRQASGMMKKSSQSHTSILSQKSGRPRSFTLTGLFASAWSGVTGKLPVEDHAEAEVEQEDEVYEESDSESTRDDDSEHGLSEVFAIPGARDRRQSTSSAKMSLQRIMSIDNSKFSLK